MAAVAFVLAVAVCAVLSPGVYAHGSLRRPVARQFCNPDGLIGVMEEAGNGARGRFGASADKNGGMPSFCGDPFEGNDERGDPDYINHPCPIQETYTQGGIVSMELAVMYDHGGSWEVAVCCDDKVTQKCLDKNKLTDAEFGDHMWYIQENAPPDPNNREIQIYKQDWNLPDDVYGDKCLLVWTWWTGHRCIFWPCDEQVCGAYSLGKSPINKPDMLRPGSDWTLPACERYPEPGHYPQIFRNCADVSIEKRPGGGVDTTSDTPEVDTTGVTSEDTAGATPEDDTTSDTPEDRASAAPRPPARSATGAQAPETDPQSPITDGQGPKNVNKKRKTKVARREPGGVAVESTFEQNDEEEKMPSYLNAWLSTFGG